MLTVKPESVLAINKDGQTALHLAASNGHTTIIEKLLYIKPESALVIDNYGKTALHYAAQKGEEAIVQKLLTINSNLASITDNYGKTALHYAVEHGKEAVVQKLLVVNSDSALTKDEYGKTALHYAVQNGKEYIAKKLLTVKPELILIADNNNTALQLSTKDSIKTEITRVSKKIANEKFQSKQDMLKVGEQKVLIDKQAKEELSRAMDKQAEELKALNSSGNDESLATNGNKPHYWYSIEDGVRLLLAMRQEHLDYSQSPAANYGEEYVGIRENNQRIFLGDPYYSSNFVNYLTDDINRLTSSENFVGKKAWDKMPTKLILPFVSGMHWRNVQVAIDYSAKSCQILFDDPYGEGAFPANLKAMVLANLKNQIQKLISIENEEPNYKLLEQSITVNEKIIDQQGKGTNSWDCGPINFSNINDLVKHAVSNSKEQVKYAIDASNNEHHTKEIINVRAKHLASYSQIAVSNFKNERTQALTKQVVEDRALHIDQISKLIISSEHQAIAEKIVALKPIYISILFDLLEEQRDIYRSSNKNSKDDGDYSYSELKSTYEFVIKEIIEPSYAVDQQMLITKLSKEELIVQETFKLIAEGNARIQKENEKSILIMGKTGAGKSSLVHLLSSETLIAVIDQKSGDMHVEAVCPLENIIISHQNTSATKIPGKVEIGKTTLWDCPGFRDTKGIDQEIANSFYIKRLFETSKQLKFILAISEASLANRGVDLVAITEQFARTFNNIKALDGCVSLVITQATPGKRPEQIKYVINNIIEQNQSASEQTKEVLTYLLKSVYLFHTPIQEGELKANNLLQNIDISTTYLSSKDAKLLPNIAISNDSIEYANELLNTTVNTTNNILRIITKAVENANLCLQSGGANIFNSFYFQVKNWLPKERTYKMEFLKDHQTNEYFLALNQLSELLDTTQSNASAISSIINLLEKFAEYTVGNAYFKMGQKQQLQDYVHVFKQHLECVKFLSEVCNKPKEMQIVETNLTDVLASYKIILSNALKDGVTKIILNKVNDQAYYQKALSYIDQYPNEPACIKIKSKALEHLGRIEEQNGFYQKALIHYLDAALQDHTLNTAYQKIGNLLFKAKHYVEAINCYKIIHDVTGILNCYESLIKLHPNDPMLRIQKSDYLISIGYNKATSGYHEAFYLSNDLNSKAMAWQKIGERLDIKGENAKAKEFKDKALSKNFYSYDKINVQELKDKIIKEDLIIKIDAFDSENRERNTFKTLILNTENYIQKLEEALKLDQIMINDEKEHSSNLLGYIKTLEQNNQALKIEIEKNKAIIDHQESLFKSLENDLELQLLQGSQNLSMTVIGDNGDNA